MKWITIILGYLFFPLLYFTIYLPFIIPRLNEWHRIPFLIMRLTIIAYVIILAGFGIKNSHKTIVIHAFGISCFIHVFMFTMSVLRMPSFLKSYESGFLPEAIPSIVILGIAVALLAEAGHVVLRMKGGTSNMLFQRIAKNRNR